MEWWFSGRFWVVTVGNGRALCQNAKLPAGNRSPARRIVYRCKGAEARIHGDFSASTDSATRPARVSAQQKTPPASADGASSAVLLVEAGRKVIELHAADAVEAVLLRAPSLA